MTWTFQVRWLVLAAVVGVVTSCASVPQQPGSLAVPPPISGNNASLIRSGESAFDSIWAAIDGAQDHVNLEFFIFEDVEHKGRTIVDMLSAKQKAGVQVNLIYDGYGSDQTPFEVFDRLKDAGVNVVQFNPAPVLSGRITNPNHRDHRKIAIVDGRVAVVGGINLAEVYTGGGSAKRKDMQNNQGRPPEKWRDTDLRIEGPAVAELQRLFLAHWKEQTGKEPPAHAYFPTLTPRGSEEVQIIGSSPDDSPAVYYGVLLERIHSAKNRVWIMNPYFAPTEDELEQLEHAAKRGVDVRLLVQGQSDAPRVRDIGRSHYEDLMAAGAHIWELNAEILHSKTTLIDKDWAAIGSSNFDGRSVQFNDEVDAIVSGQDIASALAAEFERASAEAEKITPEDWANRPLWQKMREHLSRLWAYWM